MAFLKYLASKSGANIVYRFQGDGVDEIKDELEKVTGYPFVSNIVGRFLKVSDYGIKEDIKHERELAKTENARKILDARESLGKLVNEEILTEDDIEKLSEKTDMLPRNIIKYIARRQGNIVAEELWSVFQTGSKEEKVSVLKKIKELDAMGRKNEKYRWFYEINEQKVNLGGK